jgi:hypothetical protein
MDTISEICRIGKFQNENKLALLNFAAWFANLISVSTVAEIESAISTLPVKDARSLAEWLRHHLETRQPKPGDMKGIIEVMSKSFPTGEHDIAARHNEHQP